MKHISDVPIGHKFMSSTKGQGTIIDKTKRTLTARFKYCTTKVTYNKADCEYPLREF